MRCWFLFALLAVLVADSMESCYMNVLTSIATECTTADGVTIALNDTVTFAKKCERCSCLPNAGPKRAVALSCCGYGIHAGPMMPPPGCKIVTENDGCTPKLVQIADETKLC